MAAAATRAQRPAHRFSRQANGPFSVRKAIATALHRIEAADPALARLVHGTVRTGAVCVTT